MLSSRVSARCSGVGEGTREGVGAGAGAGTGAGLEAIVVVGGGIGAEAEEFVVVVVVSSTEVKGDLELLEGDETPLLGVVGDSGCDEESGRKGGGGGLTSSLGDLLDSLCRGGDTIALDALLICSC